jgi:hypothetical protein
MGSFVQKLSYSFKPLWKKAIHQNVTFFDLRTYAKLHAVGAIHELPLPENKGLGYFLRKSWISENL